MIRDLTVSRIALFVVALAGFVFAIYAGTSIGEGRGTTLLMFFFGAGVLFYLLKAGNYWWIAYPFFVAFTGFFWVGFKLYSFELGLCLVLMALVIHLALGGWQRSSQENRIPILAVLVSLFTFFHMLASFYWAKDSGEGGYSNIGRSYSEYLWPLLFLFVYGRYGCREGVPIALNLFFGMFFFRALLSVARIWMPQMEGLLYIPGINFVPLANLETDLRDSCLAASYIALGKVALHKNWWAKGFWAMIWLLAGIGIAFGGGRIVVPLYALGLVVLAILYQRWIPLAGLMVLLGGGLGYLNANPAILDLLPKDADKVRRALSGLLLNNAVAGTDSFQTGQSDEFHRLLRDAGQQKWSRDVSSILVGNVIRKFDYESSSGAVGGDYLHQLKVDAAVATGRYEKGLWMYLAVFGIMGFALYLGLVLQLLARPLLGIWRQGIRDAGDVFGLFAIISMVGWVATSNLKSGYLSLILFAATFAYFWGSKVRPNPWLETKKPAEPKSSEALPGAVVFPGSQA